jgi:TonB-linked SusC/RagA family outer membrane protein
VKNESLEKVFKQVKKQSGFSFIYTKEELADAHLVSFTLRNADIRQLLQACFEEQPLTYTLDGNHVVVKKKQPEIFILPLIPFIDVLGRVVNEKGEPVEGVSIKIKGTLLGTSTNENGEFRLNNIGENSVLIFSGTNVETYELKLNGKTSFPSIVLKTKISKLDELQVIGYGTNTQRYNLGSVSKLSSEEIEKQPVLNPLATLQGRIPGLLVTPTSGLPGASFSIQVRGQNHVNPTPGSNPPLDNPFFIIDGVPFAPQNNNLNQFVSIISPLALINGNMGGVSPLSSINPTDIESIEVLRDADATAIYGSRGANGVVIITTKKGKPGKTRFSLNLYTGMNTVAKKPQFLNTQQYLEMRREAFKNDGRTPSPIPGNANYAPDLLIFDTTRYTDWVDYFIGGTSHATNINTSLSGGSENTTFMVGSGFRHETNIYPGDFSYNVASFNSNLSHFSSDKRLHLTLSANYSYNINNTTSAPNMATAFSLPPNYPELLDVDGNLLWYYKGISLGGVGTHANPLSWMFKKYSVQSSNLVSHLQLDYSFPFGLTARTSLGYNSLYSKEFSGNPAASQDPTRPLNATASFGNNNYNTWIIEPQIEYRKKIKTSAINFLAGATFQRNTNDRVQLSGSGYISDNLLNSISAAPTKYASDAFTEYKYAGIFSRLNYQVNKKYIVNFTGRRDGSSRFGPGRRFGNFYSAAAGWLFGSEPFIQKALPILSYGKLRTSYGTTGSDGIGDYEYIAKWLSTNYLYQGQLGYIPQNLFNDQFGWQETKKLEAAIELGFLQDRFLVTATWYRNRSGNQLISYPLPFQTGFNSVRENLGALVQNNGWEFQVNSSNIKSKDFTWTTAFNLSIPKNKLVKFPGIETTSYATRYIVGTAITSVLGFHFLALNDTTGLFQFTTQGKNPTYTPLIASGRDLRDYEVIANTQPYWYGGINNSIQYKNFDCTFFLEFCKQQGKNLLGNIYEKYIPGMQYNQPVEVLNRWQNPGDRAVYERYTTQATSPAGNAARSYFNKSDGVYSDASYLRFKTVSLAYNLPHALIGRLKMQNCKIYMSAQNLVTITSYEGLDPETQQLYALPSLRTITAGLQLIF